MYRRIFIILFLLLLSCSRVDNSKLLSVTKIAFGSCGWEKHPLPIFNHVVDHNPNMFIFLGDNIYGDTQNMDTLRAKYGRLGNKKSYQNMKKYVPIYAVWDDHDYGWNDIGKYYPFKEESKEIFLDFFDEPMSSSRRRHEGIYHSFIQNYGNHKLQIILLDGRTFRDDLKPYNGEFEHEGRYSYYRKDYAPHTDQSPTLLGKEQWDWLEKEFKKKADVRIVCTGTQFGIEWNGYEAWANFPHEQKKMINLIKSTKANGVIFISGDVHYSEISKLETNFYSIFDFTASGLSSIWYFATPNKNRIEGPVMDNHFGLITLIWDEQNTTIKMETWDINKNQRIDYTLSLSELQFDE